MLIPLSKIIFIIYLKHAQAKLGLFGQHSFLIPLLFQLNSFFFQFSSNSKVSTVEKVSSMKKHLKSTSLILFLEHRPLTTVLAVE